MPVHRAALVDAVEEAAIFLPNGAHAPLVVFIGAVEGHEGVVGVILIDGIPAHGSEIVGGLYGILVALHLAELHIGENQGVGGYAVGGISDLQADDRVFDGGAGGEGAEYLLGFTGIHGEACEVCTNLVILGSALDQAFTALGILGRNGKAVVILHAVFHGGIQGQVGLDAPHAALGGIGGDGHLAVSGLCGGAVTGFHIDAFRVFGGVNSVQGFFAGNLIDLNLVHGDGEVFGGGVFGVVGVGGDLAQVQHQLAAALPGAGEVQGQG